MKSKFTGFFWIMIALGLIYTAVCIYGVLLGAGSYMHSSADQTRSDWVNYFVFVEMAEGAIFIVTVVAAHILFLTLLVKLRSRKLYRSGNGDPRNLLDDVLT
jgi:hypothetical protein